MLLGLVCLSRLGLCRLLLPLMLLHLMVLCSISGRVGAHPTLACRAGLGRKGMWWIPLMAWKTERVYRDVGCMYSCVCVDRVVMCVRS